ncbi:MAG: FkbM family methyltransferase, partial [Paracoccaceae bacterium]
RSRGMKFPKHPQFTTGQVRGALRQDTYERRESEAVLRVVEEGDTVLELGAGLGYMSTLVAISAPGTTIHAFEANPALIPYIREVHAANGVADRVTVHNALLAARKSKPVPFYVRENFLGSSLDKDAAGGVIETHEIEVRGFGATLRELKPDILVCDIEGAEADLLPAADLSRLRAAVVELHPQWIGQAGVQAVFDAMHKAGLTYFPKTSNAKVVTFRKNW